MKRFLCRVRDFFVRHWVAVAILLAGNIISNGGLELIPVFILTAWITGNAYATGKFEGRMLEARKRMKVESSPYRAALPPPEQDDDALSVPTGTLVNIAVCAALVIRHIDSVEKHLGADPLKPPHKSP